MVRILKSEPQADDARYVEIACLKDDTKPTGIFATGSLCLEVDSGDVYAYDEEDAEWNKIAALGGSGS